MKKILFSILILLFFAPLISCGDKYTPLDDPFAVYKGFSADLTNTKQFEFDFQYTIKQAQGTTIDTVKGTVSFNDGEATNYVMYKEHNGSLLPAKMEYRARATDNLVDITYDYEDNLLSYDAIYVSPDFKHDIPENVIALFQSSLVNDVVYASGKKYSVTVDDSVLNKMIDFYLPKMPIDSEANGEIFITFNNEKFDTLSSIITLSSEGVSYTIDSTAFLKRIGSGVNINPPALKEVALRPETILALTDNLSEANQAFRDKEKSSYDYSFSTSVKFPNKEPYVLSLYGETVRQQVNDYIYFSNLLDLSSDYRTVYSPYGVRDTRFMRVVYASQFIYDCFEGNPNTQQRILEIDYSDENYLNDSYFLLIPRELININDVGLIKINENADKTTTYRIMFSHEGLKKLVRFYNSSIILSREHDINLLSNDELAIQNGYFDITMKNNAFYQISFNYSFTAEHSLYQSNDVSICDFTIAGTIAANNVSDNYVIPRGLADVVFPR